MSWNVLWQSFCQRLCERRSRCAECQFTICYSHRSNTNGRSFLFRGVISKTFNIKRQQVLFSLILDSLSYSMCVTYLNYQQRRKKKINILHTSLLLFLKKSNKNGTTDKMQVHILLCNILLVSLSYQQIKLYHYWKQALPTQHGLQIPAILFCVNSPLENSLEVCSIFKAWISG